MGCLPGDDCLNDEKFVKQVNITKSFCMDRTEVTRGAYKINGSKVRSLGLTVNRCNLFNPEWLSGLCINKISENQMKETELLLNDFIYKVNNKITESELDLINSINNTQNKQIRLDVYREDKLLVFMVETILDEPSDIVCEDCPVELVTWFNAKDYCVKLGKRLPTEAEWEYAARAGTETRNYWGKTKPSSANDYAWYDENTGHWNPVGQKIANGYGLYDMLGSVKEWVMDCYDDRWYNKMANYDPLNNSENCETRVLRGGSVGTDARNLRIYSRYAELPGYRTYANGFRCAKDI
jgi:formylglycine-generating enzyme required for sulfatase activity